MYFRYFIIISTWNRAGPFIWTKLNPLHLGCFVPCFVEIGPVFLEKKMKMQKVYANDDDDRQILIRKAHLSLRLRWAKNPCVWNLISWAYTNKFHVFKVVLTLYTVWYHFLYEALLFPIYLPQSVITFHWLDLSSKINC